MRESKGQSGSLIQKTGGQKKLIQHVQGECPLHGRVVGRLLQNGRMECPKCAANQARRDAMETGIPVRFVSKDLSEYVATTNEQEYALKTARGYAENFDVAKAEGAGLVFLGNVGTGKTHLACGIANYVRRDGVSVRYSTARHALDTLKDTWRRDSQIPMVDALRQFIDPSLLILDEVGVQFGTDTERGLLFDIVDGRYGYVRPTIIVSNLFWDEFERMLGLRAVDRMRENGQLLQFGWGSYRK